MSASDWTNSDSQLGEAELDNDQYTMGLEQFSSVRGLVINACINDQEILHFYILFGRPVSSADTTVVCVITKEDQNDTA